MHIKHQTSGVFKNMFMAVCLLLAWLGGMSGAYAGDTAVYYIQTDQLNTPRVITDQNQAVVWKWESDAFGSVPPNEQPGTAPAFVFNPRFAGQYFDRESNLHYNYYRDYDPQIGRYVESDPIGLGGGINTYGYVNGRPTQLVDADGRFAMLIPVAIELGEMAWTTYRAYRTAQAIVGIANAIAAENNENVSNAQSKEDKSCPEDQSDPCKDLKNKIKDVQSKLDKKRQQLFLDKYDLYNKYYDLGSNPNPKQGTYVGHVDQIIALQRGLDKLMKQAKDAGCL
jgi:RHS repeat-associated protein